ncbi:TCP-1/cpn60 chaperonin family protein [Halobium salinum]|uniref:TCP-1/cpn60 chaperonin family protein n=1 Tax=Halobium salinum TaxID=1364940 RepID=A0ABD5PI36_9EURY|nr:TCP-1/cpn60 chaperonin family protein [Halobium salinum]
MSAQREASGEPEPQPQFPHANIVAVRAMADVLESTLGPVSHDKLVVHRLESRTETGNPGVPATDEYTVTGDGATLLEELPVQHPVAPIVRRILGPERPGDTDVEGEDIPDGVTSAVVLCANLLDEAESLLADGVHSHDVRGGYALALDAALAALDGESRAIDSFAADARIERALARTAMTGNDVGGLADRWATLAVEAVDAVGRPTAATFAVRALGAGSLADSHLVRGAALDRNGRANREMPKRVEDATVLLLDGHTTGGLQDPEWDEDATLSVTAPGDIDGVRDLYAAKREEVVEHYVDLGVDVVVTRLGINAGYQRLLADAGILGVRGVSPLEMKQVALATGASLVHNPADVEASDLGHAGVVEERRIDPRRGRRASRRMTVFDDCPDPRSVTAVLHGVTGQVAEQASTEVRKAAAAVATARGVGASRPGVVPGAGATELRLAAAVRESATGVDSKAQLAALAFADALESVVASLVRNSGGDPLDVVADLRAADHAGEGPAGYLLPGRIVGDPVAAGVVGPAAYTRRALVAAVEVADLLLRVDDAIDATFTEEPAGPDDVIYDERAENHMDHLEKNPGTRWDR